MITTDSRGVKYDVSLVKSRQERDPLAPFTCAVVERAGPRPVDDKREARRMRREEKISAGVHVRAQWPK